MPFAALRSTFSRETLLKYRNADCKDAFSQGVVGVCPALGEDPCLKASSLLGGFRTLPKAAWTSLYQRFDIIGDASDPSAVDSTEPKRPPSAYFLFAMDCQRLGDTEGENRKWSDMTDYQRKPFESLALEMKIMYDQQAAEWKEKGRFAGQPLSKDYVQERLLQLGASIVYEWSGCSGHGPSSSSIQGQRHVPETVSGLSQMAQLKPHVMELIRQTGMLGQDLPESEASLLHDRYFSGVQLQPSNTEDLDYLAGFLKALEDARMCVQP